MNRILIVFFSIIILSGCSSSKLASYHIKKAKKSCPECFEQTYRIEYKDTIIYKDTTIELLLSDFLEIDTTPVIKFETEYVDKIVKIYPTFDTIIKSNKGLTAKIWMKRGRLNASFDVDSTLIHELKDSIRVLIKETTKTNTVITEEKTDVRKYFVYGVILLLLVLLIVILKK